MVRICSSRRSADIAVVVLTSFVATLAFSIQPVRAELHSGTVLISPAGAWDFSDAAEVSLPNGDLYWVTTLLVRSAGSPTILDGTQFYHFVMNPPARIAYAPGDSTYEELTTAPSDTSLYGAGLPFLSYAVYVVRTQEMHYAKMRSSIVGGGGITIEYTYQDDGSRVLARPVAVRPSTWGSAKGLYK